ncbi:shikimate dehydrogenase [Candidatus Riesia pediculicola]|uniref:shikimate dehydrogenase n=1 Tax=Candidatus Riesia pediculicola TaxID=401619 RepID=UPI0009C357F0|nr:shikimate dehydrogenase [Candidatus Riesia pediculicola]ARC54326.1 hypothetical protein AOE57_01870 [Candidatus Riesia pediculicola]
MEKFAIFGNPIHHSRSPIIHKLFAKQIGLQIEYRKKLVFKNQLQKKIHQFFYSENGNGLNITTPLKGYAYKIVHKLTNRAKLCGSINVIKLKNKMLFGDNMDGIGLIMDLKKYLITQKKIIKILIIGAGNASRSAIVSLLQYPVRIVLVNRTYDKSKKISYLFHKTKKIQSKRIEEVQKPEYDIIINATSSGMFGKVPKISPKIFDKFVFCYDMFYKYLEDTPFIKLARKYGVLQHSDGIGMLVWQAAFSFKFWTGKMPNTKSILKEIRAKNKRLFNP